LSGFTESPNLFGELGSESSISKPVGKIHKSWLIFRYDNSPTLIKAAYLDGKLSTLAIGLAGYTGFGLTPDKPPPNPNWHIAATSSGEFPKKIELPNPVEMHKLFMQFTPQSLVKCAYIIRLVEQPLNRVEHPLTLKDTFSDAVYRVDYAIYDASGSL